MECQYIWDDVLNRTPVHRMFSVYSLISAYNFSDIRRRPSNQNRYEHYDFWQLFYIKQGSCQYTLSDGTEHTVSAGQAFFRLPYRDTLVVYNEETQNNVYIISFECSSRAMDNFSPEPFQLFGEEEVTLTELIEAGTRIFEPVHPKHKKRGLQLKKDASSAVINYVSCSLERLLNMLYCRRNQVKYYLDESEKINRRIHINQLTGDVIRYLEENINRNPSIEEISAKFGLNPNTLMKLFKQETTESIVNYLTKLKVKEAMRLIAESSKNFTEISEELGFSSVGYFSRVFKKISGYTPTEFSRLRSKKR